MNDAFIAMQHREELADTLFFAGYINQFSKSVVRGKKCYVHTNDKFCLTISGRSIIIDDIKYRNVRDVKRHICERYL